jgi:hypothetical protein
LITSSEANSRFANLIQQREAAARIEELEAMKLEHPVDSPEHNYIMSWIDRRIANLKKGNV